MNKLSDLTILKQLLKEKQNKLSTLKYEYEAIVEQEPYMRNRLKNRQYSIHKLAGEIKSIEKEIKTMESKHLQDSMEILRLSGFTTDADPKAELIKYAEKTGDPEYIKHVKNLTNMATINARLQWHRQQDSDCGEKVYTRGAEDGWKHYRDSKGNVWELVNAQGSFWMMECIRGPRKGDTVTFRKEMVESSMTEDTCVKDDDATEMGTFEQLGQNHETEAMEPEEHPVQAQDGIRFVTWVKPSGLKYQIGDIIQFKGKNVKITKITGNVVEAQVMDACTKDEEVGEKFKTVMEEFGKGELKSSSGETVTDPKQAKAIAYSEQREANDGDIILPQHEAKDDLTDTWTIEQCKYVIAHSYLFTPTVVEAAKKALKLLQAKGAKDSDPKVAEAKKLIDLFGGAM